MGSNSIFKDSGDSETGCASFRFKLSKDDFDEMTSFVRENEIKEISIRIYDVVTRRDRRDITESNEPYIWDNHYIGWGKGYEKEGVAQRILKWSKKDFIFFFNGETYEFSINDYKLPVSSNYWAIKKIEEGRAPTFNNDIQMVIGEIKIILKK